MGLLDSGATVSVILQGFAMRIMKLGLSGHKINEQIISTADGTYHTMDTVVHLPVEFLGKYNVVDFYVMNYLKHDILLGMNFFEIFKLSIGAGKSIADITEINVTQSVISRDDLSAQQRERLDKLLEEMAEEIGKGLGRTSLIEHRIDTGDSLPIKHRQYPFAPPIMAELEKEIQEMLDNDVIEPSISSWRSPVLLVKKPSGRNRLCLDCRQLNRVTVKDSYPLPRVTTILDSLKNARFLSTIDLRSAFWHCIWSCWKRTLSI